MLAAPGNQLSRSLRQRLLSGVCSCLGAGGSRSEIWQRFPYLLAEQRAETGRTTLRLAAEGTRGWLIYCSVWRTSSCLSETVSGGDGGKGNPVPMATTLKSSKVKMMAEAARENEF